MPTPPHAHQSTTFYVVDPPGGSSAIAYDTESGLSSATYGDTTALSLSFYIIGSEIAADAEPGPSHDSASWSGSPTLSAAPLTDLWSYLDSVLLTIPPGGSIISDTGDETGGGSGGSASTPGLPLPAGWRGWITGRERRLRHTGAWSLQAGGVFWYAFPTAGSTPRWDLAGRGGKGGICQLGFGTINTATDTYVRVVQYFEVTDPVTIPYPTSVTLRYGFIVSTNFPGSSGSWKHEVGTVSLPTFTAYPAGTETVVTFSGSGNMEMFLDLFEYFDHGGPGSTSAQSDNQSELTSPHENVTVTMPQVRTYSEDMRRGGQRGVVVSVGGSGYSSVSTIPTTVASFDHRYSPYSYGLASIRVRQGIAPSGFSTCVASVVASFLLGDVATGALSASLAGSIADTTGSSATQDSATAAGRTKTLYSAPEWVGRAEFRSLLPTPRVRRLRGAVLDAHGNLAAGADWEIETRDDAIPATLETVAGPTPAFDRVYSLDQRQSALYLSAGDGLAIVPVQSLVTPSTVPSGHGTFPFQAGARVKASAATAHGLGLPRLTIRGRSWPLRTVQVRRVAYYGTTDPETAAWDTGAITPTSVTATLSSGMLHLVTSGSGTPSIQIATDVSAMAYRYHRVRYRCTTSAGQSITLSRGQVTLSVAASWTLACGAAGEWREAELDVFRPAGSLPSAALAGTAPTGAWVLQMPNSQTFELEYLRGEAHHFAISSILNLYDASPAAGVLDLCVDGMSRAGTSGEGWEESDASPPAAGKPWSSDRPWEEMISAPDDYPAGYWYDSENSRYEGGAGILHVGAGVLSPYADRSLLAPESALVDPESTLAQDVLEGVRVNYPAAGDVFGTDGGYWGVETAITLASMTGSRLVAVLISQDLLSLPDVVAYQTSPSLIEHARAVAETFEGWGVGDGTLEARAYSLRLDPETDTGQRLAVTVGTAVGNTKYRESIYSLWVILTTSDDWLSADLSPTGRATLAYVTGSSIRLAHASRQDAAYPGGWTEVDTGQGGQWPCVRYEGATGLLLLAYEESGSIKLRTTEDEGGVLDVAITVFSGAGYKYPALAVSETGLRHAFAYNGGAVKAKTLDQQGNTVIAEASAIASGVADDAIAAYTRDGRVYLAYRDSGTGAVKVVSSVDGVTFS